MAAVGEEQEQRRREREKQRGGTVQETAEKSQSRKEDRQARAKARAETAHLRKAIKQAESEMEKLGSKREQLHAALAAPETYNGPADRVAELNRQVAEVEKALVSHPAILEAIVIGVPDEKWGEVGAAFLILRPGKQLDTASLLGWCRNRLAPYKIPKQFSIAEDLPRTAAGKVQKTILKDQYTAQTLPEDA